MISPALLVLFQVSTLNSTLVKAAQYMIWRMSGYGVLIGFAIALGGPAILLGASALDWLQLGIWRELTNADALAWLQINARPTFSWVGLQRTADAILRAPLWWTAMAAGATIFYACLKVLERTEPGRAERKAHR